MAWDEERIEEFKRHILQPNDTFTFSCDMCGNCCRNRDEPILMTGADIFRIAKGLGISTLEVLFKHTRGYIGDTTHLPVAVLKERLDGSCSFLRKGKCTIQAFKPTPCALYPLGRMYDERDKKFYYFNQPYSCGKSGESGKYGHDCCAEFVVGVFSIFSYQCACTDSVQCLWTGCQRRDDLHHIGAYK